MKWDEAKNIIKEKSCVIVTGPNRSGTTIAAKIIEDELGFEYIDEDHTDLNNLIKYKNKRCVIQGPMRPLKHPEKLQGFFVVYMRRPRKDIVASYRRVNMDSKTTSGTLLEKIHNVSGEHDVDIVDLVWEGVRGGLEYLELEYESLSNCRRWIPKEDRKGFGMRRWK